MNPRWSDFTHSRHARLYRFYSPVVHPRVELGSERFSIWMGSMRRIRAHRTVKSMWVRLNQLRITLGAVMQIMPCKICHICKRE
ncbi:hypothetical protein EDP1_2323 [Pseudomonas putida S610]|nr:hypothetical protein EDP1_2323 [Pseudomonas putida S610]